VNEIHQITLKQIIVWVTKIQPGDLQDNVFFHSNGNYDVIIPSSL